MASRLIYYVRKALKVIAYIALLLISSNCPAQITFNMYYGSTAQDEFINAAKEISDGGYIFTGVVELTSTNKDMIIGKTDSLGNLVWLNRYGGSTDEAGYDIIETSDGGFIAAGATESYSFWQTDVYLVKVDSNGAIEWSHSIGDGHAHVGSTIIEATDEGFIIAGSQGHTSGFEQNWKAKFIKIDSTGALVWNTHYGFGSATGSEDVTPSIDGGYASIGTSYSTFTGYQAEVIKIDSLGDTLWTKLFELPDSVVFGTGITESSTGDLFISGQILQGGGYMAKLNQNGDFQWGKRYDLNVRTKHIQTNNGQLVVAGMSSQGQNLVVVKFDLNGDIIWSNLYSWNVPISSFSKGSISQTSDNGFLISGTILMNGTDDGFLLKIDDTGDVLGCPVTSAGITSSAFSLVVNNYLTGSSVNDSFFVFSDIRTAVSVSEGSVCSIVGIPPVSVLKTMSIYPNPATNHLTIQWDNAQSGVLEILNPLGQQILSTEVFNQKHLAIECNKMKPGLYTVRLRGVNDHFIQKLVIHQ